MRSSDVNLSRANRLSRQRRIFTGLNFGLIFLAPFLAFATYLTLGTFGQGRESDWLRLVLLCDLIYLLTLIALVLQRVMRIISQRRKKSAGSRLHLRLSAVFSAMSLFPTATVAVFALLSINMGLEAWFSERVQGVISSSLSAAQAYEEDQISAIKEDARSMVSELKSYRKIYPVESQAFREKLSEAQENIQRGLQEAFIIDYEGHLVLRGNRSYLFDFESPNQEQIDAAYKDLVIIRDLKNNELRALVYLNDFKDHLLLISREIDGNLFALLDETQEEAKLYQQLESERGKWLFQFGLLYLLFAVLLIVASVFTALFIAERLSRPIGRLTGAAQKVGDGALDTRVIEEEGDDEISQLSRYFNQMTSQLKIQRDTLIENSEQIEQRRRMFDSVLSSVASGVLGLDAQGKVSFANKSAERLLGWDKIQEETELSVAVPEFFPLFEKLVSTQNESLQEELKMVRSGRLENLLVRVGRRRNEEELLEGYVIAFDDVTDLVSAQRSAAWGDVARRIAHEIKNPLTPIQLSAERIKRKFAPKLPDDSEELEKMTGVIVRQTDDLRKIVDEFSRFARLPEPQKRIEDLGALVSAAVLLQEAGQPTVNFKLDLHDHDVLVEIDATMISQSLINLLKNAGEAIEARQTELGEQPKGEIRICLEQQSDKALITISDNGIGLPEDRARLFEPYVTTRKKGTGLGLAIVKKIIEEHGGILRLSDAVRFGDADFCGAKAVIDLPLTLDDPNLKTNEGTKLDE
ncbi:MAG: PAS domain-containing sensor histidine kinase [Paracoccaceae bacterium]|nr:PAS domain-containing sensor histidine kinase [Paracoccaceae bacterium]